ncbi:MAG: MarR family transcriptional regulator [Chloroflexi bacterium]|nr:MAG: MarR family transcriptional regulator [Chloroflexota bacterium]
MFFTPGMEQLDPALLAFVKCHVTSPVKWEVLRVMAGQDGAWTRAEQLARRCHRQRQEISQSLAELVADGVLEILLSAAPDDVSYRLAADEPTSVVLHRLIDAATHSQQLRAIIAAHMQHVRQQAQALRSSAAA